MNELAVGAIRDGKPAHAVALVLVCALHAPEVAPVRADVGTRRRSGVTDAAVHPVWERWRDGRWLWARDEYRVDERRERETEKTSPHGVTSSEKYGDESITQRSSVWSHVMYS